MTGPCPCAQPSVDRAIPTLLARRRLPADSSEDMEMLLAERSWTGHDLPGACRTQVNTAGPWIRGTRTSRWVIEYKIIRTQCPKPYTSEKT